MHPKVELVSWTPDALELLYATEKFAKTNVEHPLLTDPAAIACARHAYKSPHRDLDWTSDVLNNELLFEVFPQFKDSKDPWGEYVKDVESWGLQVAKMAFPLAEMIHFVFRLSDVTIAFREQLVRHRTNSYWIQGGRITDQSDVFDKHKYNIPDSISGDTYLTRVWQDQWKNTQETYKKLKQSGIPDEDCREIIGSGVTHRLTMGINLRSLIELCKSRCCYIIQGHWIEVVRQIIQELKNKVDPIFGVLGYPPCWDSNKQFIGCKFNGVCEERLDGKDPHPVCPIWFEHSKKILDSIPVSEQDLRDLDRWNDERNTQFNNMWSRRE
jgi:thymidylate synthase ThyX